jgi:predicted ester cyclase
MTRRHVRLPAIGVVIVLAAMSSLFGCAGASQLDRNRQIVMLNAEGFNQRDRGLLAETMSPDLRRHCQATPDIDVRSLEEFVAFAESDWAAFPDSVLTIERTVAEGDLVGVWGRYTGTQQGPMGPFPAAGGRLDLDFAGVFRIEDGKIAEIWVTWDNLAALAQLGHWPP